MRRESSRQSGPPTPGRSALPRQAASVAPGLAPRGAPKGGPVFPPRRLPAQGLADAAIAFPWEGFYRELRVGLAQSRRGVDFPARSAMPALRGFDMRGHPLVQVVSYPGSRTSRQSRWILWSNIRIFHRFARLCCRPARRSIRHRRSAGQRRCGLPPSWARPQSSG